MQEPSVAGQCCPLSAVWIQWPEGDNGHRVTLHAEKEYLGYFLIKKDFHLSDLPGFGLKFRGGVEGRAEKFAQADSGLSSGLLQPPSCTTAAAWRPVPATRTPGQAAPQHLLPFQTEPFLGLWGKAGT